MPLVVGTVLVWVGSKPTPSNNQLLELKYFATIQPTTFEEAQKLWSVFEGFLSDHPSIEKEWRKYLRRG